MGVLNCQKCFHIENKNKDEIITGNNILTNKKLIIDLDSHQKSLSPIICSGNLYQNTFNCNKDKIKRASFKIKKGSRNDEEFTTDLENNTIEIPYDDFDDSDSFEENQSQRNYENNNIECEENYNINEEKLLGYTQDSYNKNNSENLISNVNNENNNNKLNDDIIKKFINKDQTNLNDFINERIKENRKNIINEKQNENENNENLNINFNLRIGNNAYNHNYKYNFYNNNEIGLFNGNNYNYINQKIDEEKEEDEPQIINISDINKKYISSTFSQYELKNLEQNSILDYKNSIKSEEVRTRKGTKLEASNEIINYNITTNKEKLKDEESAISYEIEYIDENNNYSNVTNLINNNEKIDINNGIDLTKINQKEIKILNFKENIEKKLDDDIGKVKNFHNQYIITDSFCDYEPEM